MVIEEIPSVVEDPLGCVSCVSFFQNPHKMMDMPRHKKYKGLVPCTKFAKAKGRVGGV